MKVIIAGSRTFNDYELLCAELNLILYIRIAHKDLEIVSGGQVTNNITTGEKYGADYLGERYAKANDVPVTKFLPDWNKYGKSAGPIRNEEMAKYAEGCIVFWDGKSKGTKNMIDLANKYKLKLHIINY